MSKQFMVLSPSHNESDLKHTNYIVEADAEELSFDDVMNRERHWFSPGSTVTIQDMGNMEHQTYYFF